MVDSEGRVCRQLTFKIYALGLDGLYLTPVVTVVKLTLSQMMSAPSCALVLITFASIRWVKHQCKYLTNSAPFIQQQYFQLRTG